jgi:AcrR family transcriptional regulator
MTRSSEETDGRTRRAAQRRTLRRAEVLRAARKVFSLRGYHDGSVSDIIEEAGVARGTFYLYFTNKRAVFDELLDGMLAQIAHAVQRIRTGPGEESEIDQMYLNVRRIIDVLESNRELTIILLKEAGGLDADFDQKLRSFYQRLSGIIEGALRLGQTMGLVRSCDTRVVSYCVLGSLKEVMLHVLTDEAPQVTEGGILAREILDYNLRGVFQ